MKRSLFINGLWIRKGTFRKMIKWKVRFWCTTLLAGLMTISSTSAQQKEAYRIYNSKGKKVAYAKMIRQLSKVDLVFFGESHNVSLCHWLELEVLESLSSQNKISLAMEMFEADEQKQLDDLLEDRIDASTFEEQTDVWSNYGTDYKPLVTRAKQLGIVVVGTNAPQHIPKLVFKSGFEALGPLPDEVKQFLPKLPIPYDPELSCYAGMLEMSHGGSETSQNFPKAQAIRDATMANHILPLLEKGSVLHINGSYHSDHHEGIVWYVRHHRPVTQILTISTVMQQNIGKLHEENHSLADFIICIPENMTRTYESAF